MNKVDELKTIVAFLCGEGEYDGVCFHEKPADHRRARYWWRRPFRAALTTTLAEKDARIAELEAQIFKAPPEWLAAVRFDNGEQKMSEKFATKDDRRRFVDDSAKLNMAQLITSTDPQTRSAPVTGLAGWAYDAAEALAAERDRRMQG